MRFPFPIMVCDVGGTNLRIAVGRAPGATPETVLVEPTAAHRGLEAPLRAAAGAAGVMPRAVLVCAAGPVEGRRVRLTNADWAIEGDALARDLGLEQGLLINDFEAQAVALPHLDATMTRAIGAGKAKPGAPLLALGPGTGLGAACLLSAGERWVVATTEAGHADFGPADAREEAFWPHLERVGGRVTFESVLSGPGLARLYAALRLSRAMPANGADAARVEILARSGEPLAGEAIGAFWRLIARCAGDLALIFLARGGVTLAGGVLPRLVDWLDPEDFRTAFEAKAPMQNLLAGIPVRLLVAPEAVLSGMARLAAAPQTYAIDYAARAWRPLAP
ncbi:MAG: glucokinase [Rhodoblastus sp.]